MRQDPYYIIKAPIITEESTIQQSAKKQYVFRVDPKANKKQIREAIQAMFPEVRVASVNTMNYAGKIKRLGRFAGRRPNWKKAVITLREGDQIDLLS